MLPKTRRSFKSDVKLFDDVIVGIGDDVIFLNDAGGLAQESGDEHRGLGTRGIALAARRGDAPIVNATSIGERWKEVREPGVAGKYPEPVEL